MISTVATGTSFTNKGWGRGSITIMVWQLGAKLVRTQL